MGGGKGGGGGQRTPQVAPISLESAQRLKIVDLICEGVKDLEHPISAKDVFLDGTPLQNDDGSYNFEGVEIYGLAGTPDQDYLPGFETSDTVVSVGTEVKQSQPVTRTITDPTIDRIRVTIGLGGLEEVKDNGDTIASSVALVVKATKGAFVVSKNITIDGRTNASYHRDVVLDELPEVPFNLTVERITPDNDSNRVRDNTTWVSYVESIDAKLNYPDSVVVGLNIDSNLFGGRVPRRTYRSHWTVVDVPVNYNPNTRTYDGTWNGQFKRAWTNNPAWIYRDLVTNERYGLARFRDDVKVDKWSLYSIARYCDELVDDGNGGQEPRFVCNAYITQKRDAYDVLSDLASCFRGITYFDGTQQIAVQDTPRGPVAVYTNANVVDGLFEYAGVSYKDIVTACIVKFSDEENGYQTDSVQYQDDDAIARFGYNVKTMTGFGVTSRGQAQRVAKWFVETSLRERETVTFSVGLEGIRHNPYDIIKIADNDYAGTQLGARIISVSGANVTLDRPVEDVDKLHYLDNTGKERYRSISSISGNVVTLSSSPVGIINDGVVALSKTDVAPRLFRAISIAENDDGTYTISAVTHDPQKEAVVDEGAQRLDNDASTIYGNPQVFSGRVEKNGRDLKLTWDVIAFEAVNYVIKIYRNGELYKTYFSDTPEVDISNLPLGDYRAEIRARDKNGRLSDAIEKTWSLSYDITALRTQSKVFAIDILWQVPDNIINDAWIELWYNTEEDITTAQRLARLTYPTSQYTLNNVQLTERFYFWARMTDSAGNVGDWTQAVLGKPSDDPSGIVEMLNGQLTQSELSKELINQLVTDSELQTEANKLTQAIQQAAQQQANKLNQVAQQQADALNRKASQLGTQISSVEQTASNNASRISTITAAQNGLTAGLEEERQARIAGDRAEASARSTLSSSITNISDELENIEGNLTKHLIDLSQFDANTWYPVVTSSLRPNKSTFFRIFVTLNDEVNQNVPFASHSSGTFALLTEWESNGNAWGAITVERSVISHRFNWVKDGKSPIINISQMTNPSRECFYLRGGAKYHFESQKYISLASVGNNYSANGQTVNHTSYDSSLAPQSDVKRIDASITETQQTVANLQSSTAQTTSALSSRMSTAESDITNLSQTVSNNQSSTAQQINQISSTLNNVEGVFKETILNLSNLNRDMWYPIVVGNMPTTKQTTIRVDAVLNSEFNSNVPFSNHYSGAFALMAEWTTNGNGWGSIPIRRQVNKFTYNWVADHKSPLIKIDQNGSINGEIFYLRGGAKYRLNVTNGIRVLNNIGSSHSANGHTAEPMPYNSNLVPSEDITRLNASITTNSQAITNINGKAQATHTIKTQAIAGGRKALAGISLGAMANETTAESSVIVMTDKFGVVRNAGDGSVMPVFTILNNKAAFNGDLIANGTILGKHIKAHETITAPNITGGSITGGTITGSTITTGSNFRVNSAGNLTARNANITGHINATSGRFNGEVYVNKLVGNITKYYKFNRLSNPIRIKKYGRNQKDWRTPVNETAVNKEKQEVRIYECVIPSAPHERMCLIKGFYNGFIRFGAEYHNRGRQIYIDIVGTKTPTGYARPYVSSYREDYYLIPPNTTKQFYIHTYTVIRNDDRYLGYDAMKDTAPNLLIYAVVFNK